MKCVPIFFLMGFSVLHLIHVIAVPNAKRNELERLKIKRAAAVSRFNKSKRNAPFKSPWKKRYAVVIRLRKYTRYLKAVAKKHLRSVKSRLATQTSRFHEAFLRTLGRHMAVLRSYKGSYTRRYWQKQSTASQSGLNGRYQTLSKIIPEQEADEDSAQSLIQFTASAFELFRQIAQEVLLRVKGFGTGLDRDRTFKYVKSSELPIEMMTSRTHQETALKWAKGDDLISNTFVPVPSMVPSLDPTPGTYPEPSSRESITETLKDHGLESSRTPEPSGLPVNGIASLPGSVLTFRRLARFAARI